jgi:hypothetical protein
MGTAESNDGHDEYERSNSGLPPSSGRANGRPASGSADLVQELIERNSRAADELKDMQVMVDEQAAALKQKNSTLVGGCRAAGLCWKAEAVAWRICAGC